MQLTNDQQKALEALQSFLLDSSHVFVLQGYAGTGKSTLLREFLLQMPDLVSGYRLVDPTYQPYNPVFTATTHKAVENLMTIFPRHLQSNPLTTASAFGMRLQQQGPGKPAKLIQAGERAIKFGQRSLIFVDEASYLDHGSLSSISQIIVERGCKVVFMGDPAQLTPVGLTDSPVFNAGFPTALLTEVVRQQANSPILDLVSEYRDAVVSKAFPSIPHGFPEIEYMDDRAAVAQALQKEMSHPDWNPNVSRILAYTNTRVTLYNDWLAEKIEGTSLFVEGAYYTNNKAVSLPNILIPASASVLVTGIATEFETILGITGSWLRIAVNGSMVSNLVFAPHNYRQWASAHRLWLKAEDNHALILSQGWLDLRRLYASTVNKAQGSTFDRCWIDLEDIATCRNPEQRARLLYVATSRARDKITFINMPRR